MAMIAVYKREKWIPAMKAKYVSVPESEVVVSYPDTNVAQLGRPQRDLYYKKFNEYFGGAARAYKDAQAKEFQRLIIKIETQVAKITPEAGATLIKQANEVLKGEIEKWKAGLRKICDECVKKAEDAVAASLAKRVTIRSIIEVILLGVIALIVALDTAAGGHWGDLVKAGGLLYGALKVLPQQVKDVKNVLARVKKDVDDITAALTQKAFSQVFPTPLEKVKAWKAILTAPLSTLDKDVLLLDKFEGALNHDLEENQKILAGMEKEAAEVSGLSPKVKDCQGAIRKAQYFLPRIREVRGAVMEVKMKVIKAELPNMGKVNAAIVKVEEALPVLEYVFDLGKSVVELVKK